MQDTAARYAPYVLSILRIVAALLFFEHGTSRLFGWPSPRRAVLEKQQCRDDAQDAQHVRRMARGGVLHDHGSPWFEGRVCSRESLRDGITFC